MIIILASLFFITYNFNNIIEAQVIKIPLYKTEGLDWGTNFHVIGLKEVEAKHCFKTPEIPTYDYYIGYVTISNWATWYNSRFKNEETLTKYQEYVKEHNIDTSQFKYNNTKANRLYALVYLYNNEKHIIIDTDFDSSFVNEKIYSINLQKDFTDKDKYISLDVKIPVDSMNHIIIQNTPIKIMTNYINNNKIGNNDSLQIFISANFHYSGSFMAGEDTVYIKLETQNYDQFYLNEYLSGAYKTSNMGHEPMLEYQKTIQINEYIYTFNGFDPFTKTIELIEKEKDSIGNNTGNYLKKMPGLDSLVGYTLVFFTGSWCGPCKITLNDLLEFHKTNPEMPIINVNLEVDSIDFVNYVNKYKIPWKIIFDKGVNKSNSLYRNSYEIQGVPALFLINPQRKILRRVEGYPECTSLINNIKNNGCEFYE